MDTVKFVPPGGHRACLSCSAAKAKCVFPEEGSLGGVSGSGPDGGRGGFGVGSESGQDASDMSHPAPSAEGIPASPRCERCDRLGRDCLLPVRPRKKRRLGAMKPGTSRPPVTATTTVTRDSNSPASGSDVPAAPSHGAEVGSGSRQPGPTPPPPSQSQSQSQFLGLLQHSPPPLSPIPPQIDLGNTTPAALRPLISACLRMEEREAEKLLQFFRSTFCKFQPLMRFASLNAKAVDLQVKKPGLWLAIVFATSYHDYEYQNRLARAIIHYFGEKLFQCGTRSLDLLQGILIFLNWFTTHNYLIPMCTTLIHMAMALVSELGLDRIEFAKTAEWSPLEAYTSFSIHGSSQTAPAKGHSGDERNTLIGCFCISNAISAGVTMMTPLQYTLQLEDTCRLFETKHGHSHPPTAIAVIDGCHALSARLYYLIRRVLQVKQEAEFRDGKFLQPVPVLVDQFRDELDDLVRFVSPEVFSNVHIKLLYHTTEMHIYKIGLTSIAGSATHTALGEADDSLHNRVRCFLALASFFEEFFTIPVSSYYQLPITIFAQIIQADITLAMLTAYFRGNTRPAGLPAGVTLPEFDDVMESLACRFQKARTIPHPLGFAMRNTAYDIFAARFRSFKRLGLNGGRRRVAATAMVAAAAAAASAAKGYNSAIGGESKVEVPMESEMMDASPMEETPERAESTEPTEAMDNGTESDGGTEWWLWFRDFKSTLLNDMAKNSIAGSAAGGSNSGFGGGTPQPRRGPGSVGSIDSLLNNDDQEPDYYAYIQQQQSQPPVNE